MIDYEGAKDEMFSALKTAWDVQTPIVVGYIPEIRWQGVEEPSAPPVNKYWIRVSRQTLQDEQSTLRDGENGQRYRTNGLIFVQLFCPKSDSENMTKGEKLAIIVRNVYRKSTLNVWFRNSRINEIPPEEKFNRFNIVAEFEYDDQC